MTEKKIFIFTGPIQSGKTTRLIQWLEKRNDVSGILTPVINGHRFFMNATTKEIFPMEASSNESEVMRVGKYVFSTSAFNQAKAILHNALTQNKSWLIVDEVGPLELGGGGFCGGLREILSHTIPKQLVIEPLQIVLVIRDSLVNAVLKYFEIENFQTLYI